MQYGEQQYVAYTNAETVFYKYVMNISNNPDGSDTIRVKMFKEGTAEPADWDIEHTTELETRVRNYIGFRTSTTASHSTRTRDVVVEKYDGATIAAVEAAIPSTITQPTYEAALTAINTLPDGLAKNSYIAKIAGEVSYEDFESYTAGIVRNLSPLEGGYGWDSYWAGSAAFNTYPLNSQNLPAIQEVKVNGVDRKVLNSYVHTTAPLFRKLAKPIDLTKDGEYYVRITATPAIGTTSANFSKHNFQFFLGTKISIGTTYSSDDAAGFRAQLFDGSQKQIGTISYAPHKYYHYVLKLSVSADGQDTLKFKIYEEGTKEPAAYELTSNVELGSESLEYITFSDNDGSTVRVNDITIERYNAAELADIEAAIASVTSETYNDVLARINSMPNGLAKSDLLTRLESSSNILILNEILYVANDDSEITDAASITDSLNVKVKIKNTYETNKSVNVILAVYQGDSLAGLTTTQHVISANSVSDYIVTGFDGTTDNKFPANSLSNVKIKTYIWEDLETLRPIFAGSELVNSAYFDDALQLYVAADAIGGDGSFGSPFSSIAEAQSYIRSLKSEGIYPSDGVVVNIREGQYFIDQPVNFNNSDSGSKSAPITYKAFDNEKVELVGGINLPYENFISVTDESVLERIDSAARNHVKQINLSDYGITNYGEMPVVGHSTAHYDAAGISYNSTPSFDLFYNNDVMNIARWPNDGYAVVESVIDEGSMEECRGMKFTINDERINRWTTATDPWVHGYWYYDWSDLSTPVKSLDVSSAAITTQYPSGKSIRAGQRFYVYNLLEELDSPGEWYLERETGILYFYPPSEDGTIILSTLQDSIIKAAHAENITISGINLKGVRGNGATIVYCKNFVIDNCNIYGPSEMGVKIRLSNNCQVRNSHIYDSGAGGIELSGGSFINSDEGRNVAFNNHITRFDRIKKTYSPAILFGGYKNYALHNEIHDAAHQAIKINGNDNVIEFNEIYDVLKETTDAGAIYAGISKTSHGNIIRNNYFHDISSDSPNNSIRAIYLDDLFDGVNISQNVFANIDGTGVAIHGGRDNTVKNNVFVDVDTNVTVLAIGLLPEFENYSVEKIQSQPAIADGSYQNPPYTKYPHLANLLEDDPLAPKYNVVKNNASYLSNADISFAYYHGYTLDYIKGLGDYENSYETDDGSVFVDVNNSDYSIRPDSHIYTVLEDFIPPKFADMGIIK